MSKLYSIKANKPYNYILCVLDLATRHCYLRKLTHKTPEKVKEQMQTIITEANKPKIIIFDNGKECLGAVDVFLKQNQIKVLKTPSYTPQVDIENLNGQIRRMLMHLFV